MKDELLLGGEQRKTASTGSINSPTAASGWSRGTPPALLARPAQKSERLQCLDACRGLNVALMTLAGIKSRSPRIDEKAQVYPLQKHR